MICEIRLISSDSANPNPGLQTPALEVRPEFKSPAVNVLTSALDGSNCLASVHTCEESNSDETDFHYISYY
jgi:hypothetical protein